MLNSLLRGLRYKEMRTQLTKKNSTKYERRVAEILKAKRIPFKFKVNLFGREVDFVFGKYVLEVNGHDQSPDKNKILLEHGFIPINLPNKSINQLTKYLTDYGTGKHTPRRS